MLTGKTEPHHLHITCVNRAVFCPVITFSACPCVEDAPTPTLPWTTEAGVSCFPELWGEGWPTRKVPCSRNKLGRSALWNTVKSQQKSWSVNIGHKPVAVMQQHFIFYKQSTANYSGCFCTKNRTQPSWCRTPLSDAREGVKKPQYVSCLIRSIH